MTDFFTQITMPFFVNAVITALLAAISGGIIGSFVVVNRISYVAGGISHAVLGGIGIAVYFNINPNLGALVFAFFTAVLISYMKVNMKENFDILISSLWAVGMSVGIIFLYLSPGYTTDLMMFLFGSILLVNKESLFFLLLLDAVIISVTFLYYRKFIYISFDEEFSKLKGININFVYTVLFVLIALTTVILVQTVGVILVIALLTIPPATAKIFTKKFKVLILLSVLFCAAYLILGLLFSVKLNLPGGASVILISGIFFFFLKSINYLLTK